MATPTFRNWDLPQRRQIFSGVRLAWDAYAHRDPIRIDCHLRPGAPRSLADDVLDGLTRPFKELPPKHLHDARGSELFDAICELPEYYEISAKFTRERLEADYEAAGLRLAHWFTDADGLFALSLAQAAPGSPSTASEKRAA